MRTNFFGEKILTPGDDRELLNQILMDNDVDPSVHLDAEIFSEEDPIYLFGGEIADPTGDVRAPYDGFHSVQECREFLFSLDINDIRVTDS